MIYCETIYKDTQTSLWMYCTYSHVGFGNSGAEYHLVIVFMDKNVKEN